MYKGHRVNKAIKLINHITRLIFKNGKDGLALTTSNNMANASQLDLTRIAEIQKVAKQIGINIPRKFDSKTSIREFFYSRDFILSIKIKMNNLLHKAVLTSNNMQSIAEPAKEDNMVQLSKKYWVGGGNNSALIKSILKQRYWWSKGSEESFENDCDFIWTSWKKNKHIEFLAKHAIQHTTRLAEELAGEEKILSPTK